MGTIRRGQGLSAAEFFGRRLEGCTMSDAHLATRIAYSTIHDIAHGKSEPQTKTLKKLHAWSRRAAAKHGVYIDPLKTLGFEESRTGTDG